jgi:uncharacterized protein YjbI with pentapeptide repeats
MESTDPTATLVTLDSDLESILQAHAHWIASAGHEGHRAVLTAARLANCDLRGRLLQQADLTGADLRHADLTDCCLEAAALEHADLTGARLIRARLDGARLQGVRGFASAQLRDASLEGVLGLTADDIAGADLTGVRLPAALADLDRIGHLGAIAGIARPLYLFVLLVNVFILLTVFSTPDVSIFTNAPSAVMPNLSTAIPAASLFWIAPLILVVVWAYQHLYMLRFWQRLAGLPDRLPDGSPIEHSAHPWMFVDLVAARRGMPAMGLRETVLIFLMWGAVPATLLAIWWRYLPVRDWLVTTAHIGIVLITAWGALRLFGAAVSQLRGQPWRVPRERQILGLLGAAMLAFSLLRLGLPWLLDLLAKDPPASEFAFPEVLGIKPKNVRWLTADLEDGDLSGTAMTRADLRYAYGHRANLTAVNLKDSTLAGADFQRGDFTRALLEDVDLSNANLDSAIFRNACLRRARLTRSDLEDSDFAGAYLGGADLRYAYLGRSRMQYANLQGARMNGADFSGADLRGAVFNCYVAHQHDTTRQPRVQCADLSGANFADADITGAQFIGADLRSARNLTPQQLQSACGLAARLPAALSAALPACEDNVNRGIAPGALRDNSDIHPKDNPCWHEMLSDFHAGPATAE